MSSKKLTQKCKHCGFRYGSHNASTYESDFYRRVIPKGTCPTHEGRMDWNNNTTTFEPLEEKEEPMIID